jgi:hypothetical protein
MSLADAIKTLATTYTSLDVAARGLVVDAAEVHSQLATVEPGSVEETCLKYLAKHNPYIPKKKESKADE